MRAVSSRLSRATLAIALVVASGRAARADDALGLAPGQLAADLALEIGLDKYYPTEPTALAADVWLGLPHAITVGAITSDTAIDRVDAGAFVCARTGPTCTRALHGGGLDARMTVFADAELAIAPRARVLLRDVDPAKPALTLGALARWHRGAWSITTDPYVRAGLANTARGNRTAVVVPVWLALAPAPRWAVALHTGYDADVAVATQGSHVPIALVVRAPIAAHFDLQLEGGFRSLLGYQATTGYRALILTLAFRT